VDALPWGAPARLFARMRGKDRKGSSLARNGIALGGFALGLGD
jgi:hypothetical protein